MATERRKKRTKPLGRPIAEGESPKVSPGLLNSILRLITLGVLVLCALCSVSTFPFAVIVAIMAFDAGFSPTALILGPMILALPLALVSIFIFTIIWLERRRSRYDIAGSFVVAVLVTSVVAAGGPTEVIRTLGSIF
jgi:hypothetical protein